MSAAGFEQAIAASEWLQNEALDRAATVAGNRFHATDRSGSKSLRKDYQG